MPTSATNVPRLRIAHWLSPILLAFVAFLVYSNTFDVPFIFDDRTRIKENASIRQLWPLSVPMTDSNRPFGMLTFALNYALHGYEVWGYHATNLTIHILAGLALLGIVHRTLSNEGLTEKFGGTAAPLAFIIALLWLVHPLNTQAVTYIVQRLESLMGLCYLLTLYCFIRAQDSPKRSAVWYVTSVLICAFGMGVKEVMVTAPVMVMWYHRAFVAKTWQAVFRGSARYYYPALFATWAVLVWSMSRSHTEYDAGTIGTVKGITPIEYLLSEAGVITHYLRLSVWPYGQCLDYSWPVAQTASEIIPPFLFIGGLVITSIWAIFRHPHWGFLGGWFFVILGPTSSVVPIVDLAFEQRMYLPLISVLAVLVFGTRKLLTRVLDWRNMPERQVRWALATAFVLILQFSVLTWGRNEVFRRERGIWEDTVSKAPANPRAYGNLAATLVDAKEFDLAEQHCRKAIQLRPDYQDAHTNLVTSLLNQGKVDAAISAFQASMHLQPNVAHALYDFGNALQSAGKPALAIDQFRKAIHIRPDFSEAYNNLAAVLLDNKEYEAAVSASTQAIQLNPKFAGAYYNRSMGQYRLQKYDLAWSDLKSARKLGFTPTESYLNALSHASGRPE
jgi:protein O-mannosyl-transferase